MIQVLAKAFGILEHVAEDPSRPHALSELARHIGVTDSCCAHIVKTLVHHNYLEKSSHGRGYILGPAPYVLARNGMYRQDIVRIAQPLLTKLVGRIHESAVLVTVHGERKYNLCYVESDQDVQVLRRGILGRGLYETATGRLALAMMPEADRQAVIDRLGLPGPAWPDIHTRQQLEEALTEICRSGYAEIYSPGEAVLLAAPIIENEKFAAALGVSTPQARMTPQRKAVILSAMRETAEEISLGLSVA